jgi:carboxypeptidase Taq
MSTVEERYSEYRERMRKIADVRSANALLQWDQETYLPPKGAALRGQQISTLSEIAHGLFADPALGDLLRDLAGSGRLSEDERRNVELTLEDYARNQKYSPSFVRRLSEQVNRTFHSWMEARRQNSFSVYQKDLDALVGLKREEAELLGYVAHPYNALLDEFEKGATVAMIDKTFAGLLPRLKALLDRIAAAPTVDDSFLRQVFPKGEQWDWGMQLIRDLQFDFDGGRQDLSEHPFSTSFGSTDVRITTRIDEADFGNMTWSCIHETGHALYEQGLLPGNYGLPLGEACSYSIHESQSRLWENNVGRGKAFWKHYFPLLQARFPSQLGHIDLDAFYRGINKVEPSLIRTEADEITYHFHVAIRYELEKGLISGDLATADIPAFWNSQYSKWLGVTVPDDKRGCLQDVHWSHGSFGYFPTYSLGSFYAAQFFDTAGKDVAGLEDFLADGNVAPLLSWLRKKIHPFGRKYPSEELCREVTAQSLSIERFIGYLEEKYAGIYHLS